MEHDGQFLQLDFKFRWLQHAAVGAFDGKLQLLKIDRVAGGDHQLGRSTPRSLPKFNRGDRREEAKWRDAADLKRQFDQGGLGCVLTTVANSQDFVGTAESDQRPDSYGETLGRLLHRYDTTRAASGQASEQLQVGLFLGAGQLDHFGGIAQLDLFHVQGDWGDNQRVETEVQRVLYDSADAEQASRMTSMGAATKNAGEMIDALTMLYNRTRQAAITKELIEIVSGAQALGD